MSSREKILAAVLQNQPTLSGLPDLDKFKRDHQQVVEKYRETFISIGGAVHVVDDLANIAGLLRANFDTTKRMITTLPQLKDEMEFYSDKADPHTFEDVEVACIRAHFAVAENGAVWLTDALMGQRIIPFICQHLAVVVEARSIVPTLHEAYDLIGAGQYNFGAFIGGPSKTADIEQALVMGAHGPITMTVFILK